MPRNEEGKNSRLPQEEFSLGQGIQSEPVSDYSCLTLERSTSLGEMEGKLTYFTQRTLPFD